MTLQYVLCKGGKIALLSGTTTEYRRHQLGINAPPENFKNLLKKPCVSDGNILMIHDTFLQ